MLCIFKRSSIFFLLNSPKQIQLPRSPNLSTLSTHKVPTLCFTEKGSTHSVPNREKKCQTFFALSQFKRIWLIGMSSHLQWKQWFTTIYPLLFSWFIKNPPLHHHQAKKPTSWEPHEPKLPLLERHWLLLAPKKNSKLFLAQFSISGAGSGWNKKW